MIKLHHLNHSRSQRILWLLEELGASYEIVFYRRDPVTLRAPQSLKRIHPLGRSPVITDEGRIIAESGAIVEYLVRRYGEGRLAPPQNTIAYDEYIEWLHYAEGSAFVPVGMRFMLQWFTGGNPDLDAILVDQVADQMRHIETRLGDRAFLVGDQFSGADIQMTFVFEFAQARRILGEFPRIAAYTERMQLREAYRRALAKGGEYSLATLLPAD